MIPAEQLIDICLGPARSQCLYLFSHLKLAEHLSSSPCDYKSLAFAVGVKEEPLYRLLRALVTIDIVKEISIGVFALTDLGRPLLADSADSLRAYVLHMNEELYLAWEKAIYSLQTGRSAFEHIFEQPYFDWLTANPKKEAIAHQAINDTQRYVNTAVCSAYDFSKTKAVCDVGGGNGSLLSVILEKYLQLNGILFDLQSGIDAAKSGSGGQLPRCQFVVGDFFTKIHPGADVYILKMVLHDWDDEAAEKILRTCCLSMQKNTRLLIVESLRPDWPQTSIVELWDFHMLVMTGGKERRLREIQLLAQRAGLDQINQIPLNSFFYMVEFKRSV